MTISPTSLFANIPQQLPEELCQTLCENPTLRIERILSKGHATPADSWYDQPQDEWVLLLQGRARLAFKSGEQVELQAGDYVLLPAHCQHRVAWTASDEVSIWLAIHYGKVQN